MKAMDESQRGLNSQLAGLINAIKLRGPKNLDPAFEESILLLIQIAETLSQHEEINKKLTELKSLVKEMKQEEQELKDKPLKRLPLKPLNQNVTETIQPSTRVMMSKPLEVSPAIGPARGKENVQKRKNLQNVIPKRGRLAEPKQKSFYPSHKLNLPKDRLKDLAVSEKPKLASDKPKISPSRILTPATQKSETTKPQRPLKRR